MRYLAQCASTRRKIRWLLLAMVTKQVFISRQFCPADAEIPVREADNLGLP